MLYVCTFQPSTSKFTQNKGGNSGEIFCKQRKKSKKLHNSLNKSFSPLDKLVLLK